MFINHSGNIPAGTPELTRLILKRSTAALMLLANPKYTPVKTIDWLVHSSNHTGFEICPTMPIYDNAQEPLSDANIRYTMIVMSRLNYPQEYVSLIDHTYVPSIPVTILNTVITTDGDLRGWLTRVQQLFFPYFADILKCLVQADPFNDPNTQRRYREARQDDHTNPRREQCKTVVA